MTVTSSGVRFAFNFGHTSPVWCASTRASLALGLAVMARLAAVFEALGNIDRPVSNVHSGWTTPTGATLDSDTAENICSRLLPRDLAALGSTCSALHAVAACIYPGIRLRLYPHQRASLAFMLRSEAGELRGGALADEPGTGKTVTMITLICRTAGLRTAPQSDAKQLRLDAAEEEWANLDLPFRRQLVYAVLKATRIACPRGYALFGSSIKEAADQLPHYRELVPEPPEDFEALRRDACIATFKSRTALDVAVLAVPFAAMGYWSSTAAAAWHPEGPEAAADLALEARRLLEAVNIALDRHRPNATAAPPPLRSGATLLVVPKPLLHHWREQIEWHVDQTCLGGEVLIDGYGEGRRNGSARAKSLRELYSPARLADAAVIVTSSERLSMEQRHATASGQPSVLCEVHWLRLVIDEGHYLGGGALTNTKVLLDALPAERRWILSGTPAKATSDADGTATLGGLLAFLRDSRRDSWPGLSRRFLHGAEGAHDELVEYLAPVMVRHLKARIKVPLPIRRKVMLDCSPTERLAYNSLVSYIQANLVLTSLKGAELGAGSDVSLLHASNLRSARAAIENIRLTCNGGGKQVASLSAEYYFEAQMWLKERYRAPKHAVERARHFMDSAQEGEPLPCDVCALPLLLLLVMPTCGHLVCPECVGSDGRGHLTCCPVCREELPPVRYPKCQKCDDVRCSHGGERVMVTAHPLDGFAYLQPGFDLQWAETLREREARALADSYVRQRREEAGRAGAPSASAPSTLVRGGDACYRCASSSSGGGDVGGASAGAEVNSAARVGDATALSHTKADYIINSIAELRRVERDARAARAAGLPRRAGHDERPLRVAVYAESRKMLDALGHFLYLRFGDDAIAQFWGQWRSSELDKFRSSRVRHWRCTRCPPRHDRAFADGREIEFPETRCYGRHLWVDLAAEHAPSGTLSEGATSFQVLVNEEDTRRVGELSFVQGTVWSVGMAVETRVRTPSGTLGPWVGGRLARFGKCGAKMPDGTPWKMRSVDCFVLLLTRDGSHGLDLSMLTHMYLADQVWDPAVEHQLVSRAYRMGATGPVTVYQLLMRSTLEETLHQMVTGAKGTDSGTTPGDGSSTSVTETRGDRGLHTPSASASSNAAGKRRASEGLAQEANANTPPGKRSRNDSVDTPPSTSGSEEPPRLPTKSSAAHAAQEVAKVHGLLKSLTYVRCDPSTVGPS